MSETEIKESLYNYCISYINTKHVTLSKSIQDTQLSLSSESKSTAGDKHDTGRAMMHLEVEKKSRQITELENLKRVMMQFSPSVLSTNIELGTLVLTNQGNYYIAISAGKAEIEGKTYFLVSMASPLAQAFKSNFGKGEFRFMNKTFSIQAIL